MPQIPLVFAKDGRVFATERELNSFSTVRGKLREMDGFPLFLFPAYAELGQDYAFSILRQRGMNPEIKKRDEPAPRHDMAHEFYHYLEFLTQGPMSREQFTEEYHRLSEEEAEDFANAYA